MFLFFGNIRDDVSVIVVVVLLRMEMGFPGVAAVKSLPANAGDAGSILREDPWRKEWQPTLVFLLGKSHV